MVLDCVLPDIAPRKADPEMAGIALTLGHSSVSPENEESARVLRPHGSCPGGSGQTQRAEDGGAYAFQTQVPGRADLHGRLHPSREKGRVRNPPGGIGLFF
ncbi:uncharacterized protein [Macaca nemestrina]|uniref:uncharacterized protein isoform X1 n=2 Tax=Macaca nemestrina TaxID=9545 RepID=UPI0039B8F153